MKSSENNISEETWRNHIVQSKTVPLTDKDNVKKATSQL